MGTALDRIKRYTHDKTVAVEMLALTVEMLYDVTSILKVG